MHQMPIKITETTSFLSKTHNWKSSRGNQIPNYWLEAFPATCTYITKVINTIIEEPKQTPNQRTTGILPNSDDTKELNNYQPITCLSTVYKMLTGITARIISEHFKEQN